MAAGSHIRLANKKKKKMLCYINCIKKKKKQSLSLPFRRVVKLKVLGNFDR